jgi:hypothetical protein
MSRRSVQGHASSVAVSRLSAVVCMAAVMAGSGTAGASNTSKSLPDWEGRRANSILLNGDWGFSVGDGGERAESPDGAQRLHWQAVRLPGPFMPWSQKAANETKVIWARRSFRVTPAQAEGLAVLRWNRIACGATAFINGRKVGANEPTGPFQVIVPASVLRPGDNEIVLKIRGAAGVPRSRSGHALIPAGFGVGMPEVTDDVWLDFADTAYMKWALALPDLAGSRVKIRVTPTGPDRLEDLKIVAQVKSWPDGKVMGEGQASARLTPSPDLLGGAHFFVEVPMPGSQPWTYEEPHLYTAEVALKRGEKVLDTVTIRFGMREITIAGGHYLLNGKTLRLRGSELVFEWNWGDIIQGKEFDYLVTEAREMSMNAFRTHTMPLPPLWANICDENGTMILAEFPCLYNYQDYKFTPEEYAIWHKNVLTDAAGWMGRLWNHPAVVIWNATRLTTDEKRQANVLRDFATAGGRVVVLATRAWDWTERCDIKVGDMRGSRAFPYQGTSHSMLAGIPPEWLMRWNGLPGTVAAASLDGPGLGAAEKVLWVREPKTCVAAGVPVVGGQGTILFSQVDAQRHVDRSKPEYDPVAERILINMLHEMQTKARQINPHLAFLPLMYFDEIRAKFTEDYCDVIDGVVVAYLQDRDEIEWTRAILSDAAVAVPGELSYPRNTPSKAGDFAMATRSAQVLPADRYLLSFRERDDFTGPTAGYHLKQLLVDGVVVWEEDVAGGSPAWRKIAVDVTEHVRGRTSVIIAFRLFDTQAVSNFGVRWHLSELRGENLEFVADLTEPDKWKVERQGAFKAGFSAVAQSGQRRFHIPFISMTAGDAGEFRQRHGNPATPERIAEWLRMSLQAWREGKCDGVVTYCLDKRPQSQTFPLARELFREFGQNTDAENTNRNWWLAQGLRIVTYEFLERSHRASDLTPDEILESLDRFGGCDLVLLKGFHYWQGQFDDSSWGHPRFRSLADRLVPRLHARGIKAGIFGFTDRQRSYGGGPDHGRIMEVWQEYVRLGADILFVDEESGSSGLDIPVSCLSHCDELRTTFKLPVGLFLYGPASQAGRVRAIAPHVDVVGEMGYSLFLEAQGDYALQEVTRQWSQALQGTTSRPVAYWTGAMVMLELGQQPGSPSWRERFGERTLARYFEDYLKRARDFGADGVFFHSLCRFSGLAADTQAEVAAAMKRVFGQMDTTIE